MRDSKSRLEALDDTSILLIERQMAQISPYFPLSHGVPRGDNRRVTGLPRCSCLAGFLYAVAKGYRKKRSQSIGSSNANNSSDIYLGVRLGEFVNTLAAGPAWCDQCIAFCDDQYLGNSSFTGNNHGGNSCGFRASADRKSGILDIRA